MAIDAVPHDLAHEPANLAEAGHTIEFGHAHRHLVSTDLWDEGAAPRMDEPRLAGGGPDARVALHSLHQQLEIASGEIEIHVQLAQVVEVLQTHGFQARVEGLDHAGPDLSAAAIGSPHDAQV